MRFNLISLTLDLDVSRFTWKAWTDLSTPVTDVNRKGSRDLTLSEAYTVAIVCLKQSWRLIKELRGQVDMTSSQSSSSAWFPKLTIENYKIPFSSTSVKTWSSFFSFEWSSYSILYISTYDLINVFSNSRCFVRHGAFLETRETFRISARTDRYTN